MPEAGVSLQFTICGFPVGMLCTCGCPQIQAYLLKKPESYETPRSMLGLNNVVSFCWGQALMHHHPPVFLPALFREKMDDNYAMDPIQMT